MLRAWKRGEDEDRMVRLTMPDHQAREFNRYIDLMNGARALSPCIIGLRALTDQLSLRYGWLLSLDLWALQAGTLGEYIWLYSGEPITESEHRGRKEKATAEMIPVHEFAELLAERHEGWDDEDLEEHPDSDEPVVSDAAWERVMREKRRELARLVEEGVLGGSGKGKRLRVNAGSFSRWLGEDVPVWPDWGFEFQVMPDDRAEEVERQRRAGERARQALVRSPSSLSMLLRLKEKAKAVRGDSWGDGVMTALEERIRVEALRRWRELLAVEMVLDEVAQEFDGEDPLFADVREVLRDTRAELEELVREIGERLGGLDLDEPDEAFLGELRDVAGLPSPA